MGMHMRSLHDIGRGDADRKPISVNKLGVRAIMHGHLMAKWDLLPREEFHHDFTRCAVHYSDSAASDSRIEHRCDIIIRIQQNGPNRTHSHVEVASPASANAFVPASTTPE